METLDPLTLYILKTKKAEYGLYLYEFGRKAELYKRKKRSFSKIRTIDMKKNSLPVCSLWIALLEEHLNMPILSLDEANQNEKDQFQNYIDGRAIRLKQNITFLAWILCLLGLGLGFLLLRYIPWAFTHNYWVSAFMGGLIFLIFPIVLCFSGFFLMKAHQKLKNYSSQSILFMAKGAKQQFFYTLAEELFGIDLNDDLFDK